MKTCKYCEQKNTILKTEVIARKSFDCSDLAITEEDIIEDTLGVFIDRRKIGTFLRLVNLDACNLEAGKRVQINFCPFCGKEL